MKFSIKFFKEVESLNTQKFEVRETKLRTPYSTTLKLHIKKVSKFSKKVKSWGNFLPFIYEYKLNSKFKVEKRKLRTTNPQNFKLIMSKISKLSKRGLKLVHFFNIIIQKEIQLKSLETSKF